MRYGYWLPVFGGWLRNVEDENMQANWAYVKCLAQRSEELGYDLTLIAELNLNDIKGVEAPSLDAWSTAAALAAVTEKLELMVAVRPTFHCQRCSRSRPRISTISAVEGFSLNVVSSCGPMKRGNTASHLSNMTTVTRVPVNGWMWWMECGRRITFRIPGNTIKSKTMSCSRSRWRDRAL